MSELSLFSDKKKNESENNSNQKIIHKLLSLNDHSREEITKLFMSKKTEDIEVVKEFMKTFNFKGMSVIDAFRVFSDNIMISGDSTQITLITRHFSLRYSDCNDIPFCFERTEVIVSLILFLNPVLHHDNGRHAVDLKTFITFFANEPPEYNFNKSFLTELYKSIKEKEIESISTMSRSNKRSPCHMDSGDVNGPKKIKNDVQNKIFFGAAFLSRKSVKTTSVTKFGWKRYFAILEDLSLSLYKFEDAKDFFQTDAATRCEDSNARERFLRSFSPVEVMPIYHCVVKSIINHDNRFLLYLADKSKYCLKFDGSVNVESFKSTVIYAAALLSRPNYGEINPEQFGSIQVAFHDGLTSYNFDDQIKKHMSQGEQFKKQLEYVEKNRTKCFNFKSNVKYINDQIEKFDTYVRHMNITKSKISYNNSYQNSADTETDSVSTYSSTGCYSEISSKTSVIIEYLSKKPEIGTQSAETSFIDRSEKAD